MKTSTFFENESLFYTLALAIVALCEGQGPIFRVDDKLGEIENIVSLKRVRKLIKNLLNPERQK